MPRNPDHPVWDVYDEFRTARLNVKYYSCRVSSLQRRNFWIEITLAATTSGSAVAGLAFWKEGWGQSVWQALLVVSALLAIAKPLLRLTERIQQLEEVAGDYRLLEHELKKLEILIRQRRVYDAELQRRFADVLDKMGDVQKKKAEYSVNEKLRLRCEAEVKRELPADHFYVPEENDARGREAATTGKEARAGAPATT